MTLVKLKTHDSRRGREVRGLYLGSDMVGNQSEGPRPNSKQRSTLSPWGGGKGGGINLLEG